MRKKRAVIGSGNNISFTDVLSSHAGNVFVIEIDINISAVVAVSLYNPYNNIIVIIHIY